MHVKCMKIYQPQRLLCILKGITWAKHLVPCHTLKIFLLLIVTVIIYTLWVLWIVWKCSSIISLSFHHYDPDNSYIAYYKHWTDWAFSLFPVLRSLNLLHFRYRKMFLYSNIIQQSPFLKFPGSLPVILSITF
jgi:hypothetical protein